MKTCTLCSEEKPLDQFKKDNRVASGRGTRCKKCANALQKVYVKTERGRKVAKKSMEKYMQTDHGRRKIKEYQQSASYRNAILKSSTKWRKNEANREKIKAHRVVTLAVKSGKLPKASDLFCGQCIFDHKLVSAQHYHHNSYKEEDRLIVHALCTPCHVEEHNA